MSLLTEFESVSGGYEWIMSPILILLFAQWCENNFPAHMTIVLFYKLGILNSMHILMCGRVLVTILWGYLLNKQISKTNSNRRDY